MIIEEPLTAQRRPLWLKITFSCFILIAVASVPSILYLPQHIKVTNQQDRILVLSKGCSTVNSTAKPLFMINPFTASNDDLLMRFKLSFENVPEAFHHTCSVVWKNSMLMFGGPYSLDQYKDQRQIIMLTGCKVEHFEQALPLMVSKAIYGFRGVCTTVQDKIMLCFGIRTNFRQCHQFEIELIGRNVTINSFKTIPESLFVHNYGTKIASINGFLTFLV